jgi:aminoglycoside phosphotransferase (APT) family kinase protein
MSDVPSVVTDHNDVSNSPKFHKDRSGYATALQTWFQRQRPEASDVTVGKIDIPSATGFSNETIFFEVDWTEGGEQHHERLVGRIEPPTGALFPAQTAECAVSVGVQYRVMDIAARNGVTICPLIGYEADASVLGQPFFVMGFVDGVIPADVPRYSEAGFLVDEATPEQRHKMVRTGLEAMASVHAIDWRSAGLEWLDASGKGEPTNAVQLQLYRDFCRVQLAGRPHSIGSRPTTRTTSGSACRGATAAWPTSSGATTRRWPCATGRRARSARPRPMSAGG